MTYVFWHKLVIPKYPFCLNGLAFNMFKEHIYIYINLLIDYFLIVFMSFWFVLYCKNYKSKNPNTIWHVLWENCENQILVNHSWHLIGFRLAEIIVLIHSSCITFTAENIYYVRRLLIIVWWIIFKDMENTCDFCK